MGKTRYYHASPKRFRRGDLLTGGHPGGYGCRHPNVCLTTSPLPHTTIFQRAVGEDWYIYEVLPEAPVSRPNGNREVQTRCARVVNNAGRASRYAQKKCGSVVHGYRHMVESALGWMLHKYEKTS